VREILPTIESWAAEGRRMAVATVVAVERSAPRDPGAALVVSQEGDVAGSVTGGCVEGAVYEEAREVLAGGPPRLKTYGIADEEAFEVGLACGGTVHIFVEPVDPGLVVALGQAVREERPVAYVTAIRGDELGGARLVAADELPDGELVRRAQDLLALGETGVVELDEGEAFVSSFTPRPDMYVFGAVDHAAALATLGRFLGYRVTVCDARARFVTRERFPDVDELVVEWPDRFLERAPVDERTAICVLTHDRKFDVPALKVALASPAGYIGAMGSRKTSEDRAERLRAEGVTDEQLARIHAPIGLRLGSQTPAEVAVAIAAELVQTTRGRSPVAQPAAS
jgi:xanthine dehydrogenase accessory factor